MMRRYGGGLGARLNSGRKDELVDSSSEAQSSPNPAGTGQRAPFDAKMIFVGPEGIRAGWRLLIYVCIVAVIAVGMFAVLMQIPAFRHGLTQANQGQMNTTALIFSEIPQAIAVLLGAVLMSLIEKRSWGVYGMPLNQALGLRFWEGMLWGVAAISAMIGLIAAFHGYSFGAIALSRPEIINKGLLYLFGFFLVGIFEEYSFRGYTQFTLATGVGFWPAAGILSGAFGALHLGNKGEGLVGAASVVMIAMFFCLTLRRTGNLWFAIGLHCSFDWGETFLFSVPNSGNLAEGSLSHSTMQGARWLTGGSVGPEGSVFCFLVVALMFLIFHLLHPARPE
jgi:membrane protease YdiL (CAAX protease family)